MDYENGFYIYTPNEDNQIMDGLSVPQVIEIIEMDIWVTGMSETFDIDYANAVGTIGKMVMSQDGEYNDSERAIKDMQDEINLADEIHFDEIVEIQAHKIKINKSIN